MFAIGGFIVMGMLGTGGIAVIIAAYKTWGIHGLINLALFVISLPVILLQVTSLMDCLTNILTNAKAEIFDGMYIPGFWGNLKILGVLYVMFLINNVIKNVRAGLKGDGDEGNVEENKESN